ncbi:CBM_collapsed_G0017550.mRNA.1.CDS.1 [Saccharomyces cerevisiae]|nr:CBM_collapsed_G0017550.mRNA.1.CDS.1 [Saccharomyces cerevisiae]
MAKLGDAAVNHTDLPHFRNNKRLTTQEVNAFQHPIVEFQPTELLKFSTRSQEFAKENQQST